MQWDVMVKDLNGTIDLYQHPLSVEISYKLVNGKLEIYPNIQMLSPNIALS